jgi:hypothetical protein
MMEKRGLRENRSPLFRAVRKVVRFNCWMDALLKGIEKMRENNTFLIFLKKNNQKDGH